MTQRVELDGSAFERPSDLARAALEGLAREKILFRRGGSIVAVRGWDEQAKQKREATGSDGVSRPTVAIREGSPVVRRVHGGALDFEIDAHVDLFVERKKKSKKDEEETTFTARTTMPRRVVEMVEGIGGDAYLQPLEGILRAPSIDPEGRLITAPGYDEETGYFLASTFPLDKLISAEPSLDRARKALAKLQDLFAPTTQTPDGKGLVRGFPWRHGWDETIVPIALCMSVIARPAFITCPAFLIDASSPASGKGKIVSLCSLIATGEEPARAGWPSMEEEQEKTINSYAMLGPSIIAWDNVVGDLSNPHLENALTTDKYDFRGFHTQELKRVPFRSAVTFTGNNLRVVGDMCRRIITCRLEPDTEHPEKIPLAAFRHPQIERYVRENREVYVAACLSILRAYIHAGMPDQGITFQSFDKSSGGLGWADLIGGALAWVGAGDITTFCAKENSSEPDDWGHIRTLLAAWPRLDPNGTGITLASAISSLFTEEVMEIIRKGGTPPPTTYGDWGAERSAIQALARCRDRDIPDSAKLGNGLRPYKDRWFEVGGKMRHFIHAKGKDGAPCRPARWKVEEK